MIEERSLLIFYKVSKEVEHGSDSGVDAAVNGSGRGLLSALVAAHHHADVLVVEKEKLWAALRRLPARVSGFLQATRPVPRGSEDDTAEAFKYVRKLSADNVPDANIKAYVENASAMLRWVTANTEIEYQAFPYPGLSRRRTRRIPFRVSNAHAASDGRPQTRQGC